MADKPFGIAIHGGSGNIKRSNLPPSLEKEYLEFLTSTINRGHAILEKGGSARQAIIECIIKLEDSPLFNAAKGAVLNSKGKVELDAALMDGARIRAGAVSGVKGIKNPILAAEAVLEKSNYVLLSGSGAEDFAREHKLAFMPDDYFEIEARKIQLAKHKYFTQPKVSPNTFDSAENEFNMLIERDEKYGTVGAVALDKKGNLVAGTSTGGMTNKEYGRVGDSPIIGAGTYANNETCAVSGTGHGEYFIQTAVAFNLHARMKYLDETIEEAGINVLQESLKLGGKGGLISIDKKGQIGLPFTTEGMFRAYKNHKNKGAARIFKR